MSGAQLTGWSENEVHRLRELIENSYSLRKTVAEMNRSFRDVYRKAGELGLKFKARAGKPPSLARSETPKKLATSHPVEKGRHYLHWGGRVFAESLPLPSDLRTIAPPGPCRPMLEREDGACAWPVDAWENEGTAQTPFCCAPVSAGSPYCTAHTALAWEPRKARAA